MKIPFKQMFEALAGGDEKDLCYHEIDISGLRPLAKVDKGGLLSLLILG